MSLRTLIKRRLEQAASSYAPNHFLLTLDVGTPFIVNAVDPSLDDAHLHVFIHEYWHYLQNVTTVSGFKCFAFTQHLLPPFSKSLLSAGDGTSAGSTALSLEERAKMATLLALWRDLDGHEGPSDQLLGDWEVDFRVTRVESVQASETYGSQDAQNPSVLLELECRWPGRDVARLEMVLGARAIEESVAFLVEEQVRSQLGVARFESPPAFPYRVAERTLEHVLGHTCTPFFAAALGSLALQTTHPGSCFLQLACAFDKQLRAGREPDSALNHVLEVHRQSVLPIISTILNHDLPSLEAMHKDRGLMTGALAHVATTMRRGFARRLSDALFDLRYVFPVVNAGALRELQQEFPSCDAIQERMPDASVFPRDILYAFDESEPDDQGNVPSIYTRCLQAQQDFVSTHIDGSDALAPSAAVRSKCPYYDACDLPLRVHNPGVCADAPWLSYRNGADACWYATAVAATLGPVRIRRISREDAAARAVASIRRRAYLLWEARGCPLGDGWVDWFRAEREHYGFVDRDGGA